MQFEWDDAKNEANIRSNTKRISQTDWDRLQTTADEEIDYGDIPPLTETFFARATLMLPNAV